MVVREGSSVTTYRFATDHLGSVRMVVNAACPQTVPSADVYETCVVWHASYDEYGRRELVKGDEGLHSFGFAGGLYDYETGLTRFGARDYDAQVGRWTARDPILFNGGQTNLYTYCRADPINLVDLSGRKPKGIARIVDLTERGMKIVSDWMDWDDAVQAAKDGEDLLVKGRRNAKDLSDEVANSCGERPTHHDPHPAAGPEARPHYHPTKDGNNHIFYNLILLFDFDGNGDVDERDSAEAADMLDVFIPGPEIFMNPGSSPEA
jgi:RHS repeat-associated protein